MPSHRWLPSSRVSRELPQDQPASYSSLSSVFPFPIRELEEGWSQVRGLGLNSQRPSVTPASSGSCVLTVS